jgi:hypothetical protein
MPNWKKVVVSGSNAQLNQVTASYFKGDGTALTGVIADTANISIKEEGSSLTSQVSSIDFVGSVVTATNSGNDITVSITSGTSLASAFDEDENDDLMPTAGGEIIPVFYELDDNSDLMPRVT